LIYSNGKLPPWRFRFQCRDREYSRSASSAIFKDFCPRVNAQANEYAYTELWELYKEALLNEYKGLENFPILFFWVRTRRDPDSVTSGFPRQRGPSGKIKLDLMLFSMPRDCAEMHVEVDPSVHPWNLTIAEKTLGAVFQGKQFISEMHLRSANSFERAFCSGEVEFVSSY